MKFVFGVFIFYLYCRMRENNTGSLIELSKVHRKLNIHTVAQENLTVGVVWKIIKKRHFGANSIFCYL